MKKIQHSLLLLILCAIATFFAWWLVPMICFIYYYIIDEKPLLAFVSSLSASGLTWLGLAFIKDFSAQVKISNILASLFGGIAPSAIYTLVFLTIGLVSGFAGLSGRLLREVK